MKKIIIALLIITSHFTNAAYSQTGIVDIEPCYFNIDVNKHIILLNKNTDTLNYFYTEQKKSILSNGKCYTFSNPISEFEIGKDYKITDSENESYDLYFTQLPIVNISTDNTIVDEPRVYANFSMCESDGNFIENAIGIEYRGATSQSYAKKSLRIEFWNDPLGNETKDFSLLGMRNDADWNLQAMYNEPLRIRSKLNYELWRKIDSLYYIDKEPEAVDGVKLEYVELFVNKEYRGLYALSERIDRKELKLKKRQRQNYQR